MYGNCRTIGIGIVRLVATAIDGTDSIACAGMRVGAIDVDIYCTLRSVTCIVAAIDSSIHCTTINLYINRTSNVATLVAATIYAAVHSAAFHGDINCAPALCLIGTTINIAGYCAAKYVYLDGTSSITVVATAKYATGNLRLIGHYHSGLGNVISAVLVRVVSVTCAKNTVSTGLIGTSAKIDVDIAICGTTTSFSSIAAS